MNAKSPLRCYNQHPDNPDANDGQHYDHLLRERVAKAIRLYPDMNAPHWAAPEAALWEMERFLGVGYCEEEPE